MNEYTVANARKIYCEIAYKKQCTRSSMRDADYNNGKFTRYGFTNELRQLADYPWYVRIWARLTYKI